MKVARTVRTGRNPKGQTRDGEGEEFIFNTKLDKTEYTVDEDITISGSVIRSKTKLTDIDITFKFTDNKGQVVSVGQVKTNTKGEFTHIFRVPVGTEVGTYTLTIKANTPENQSREETVTIVS